ncbi:MADS-box protein FBP24-like [Medicago truncatula]|uniref:MADS-box protein FBP24-like n=1 Tax=Medicago truncatula TaxID=3880 RepID=UPI000D2F3BD1|nr:MADS-box protein FBP24-like [Medicago truncatula]
MRREEEAMELENRTTRTKEIREKPVGALSRIWRMSSATSVELWAIMPMIVRRTLIVTSVGKRVTKAFECKGVANDVTCYNCGEKGHISTKCTKPKKAAGKMFSLNTEEVEQPDYLIREMFHEIPILRQESLRLELEIQRYLGDDMKALRFDDLTKIEHELEISLAKVRKRQNELMQQQIDNMIRKERILQDENINLSSHAKHGCNG